MRVKTLTVLVFVIAALISIHSATRRLFTIATIPVLETVIRTVIRLIIPKVVVIQEAPSIKSMCSIRPFQHVSLSCLVQLSYLY